MCLKLLYGTVLVVPIIVTFVHKKMCERKLTTLRKQFNDSTILCYFVTLKNRLCAPHINRRKTCSDYCSYAYIKIVINLIDSAKYSISLCMYHLTMEDISNAILRAHKRGVKVRCITDKIMLECSGSKMQVLKHRDIPVKTQTSRQSILHHKFMLIDEYTDSQKVLFGSLNFTLQGFLNNWELFTISDGKCTVKNYSDGFEYLWEILTQVP